MRNRRPRKYAAHLLKVISISLAVSFSFQSLAADRPSARIAIIIDDLGYKLAEGRRAINLAAQVTLSIIPFSPHAKKLAHFANENHKEVLLHAPMTPISQRPWESGLASGMSREELFITVDAMLADVPHASGVNNHGGSHFTQDRERMSWLMTALKKNNLFFIDSRTTAKSMGMETALEADIPYNSRDVFLDNERNAEAIVRQLDRLVSIAVKNGQAIAIGHPHNETLDVLEAYLPLLKKQGIEVVNASVLLKNPQQPKAIMPAKLETQSALALKRDGD